LATLDKTDESPALPFTGDSSADVLNRFAKFAASLANFLLRLSFDPFVHSSLLRVGIARQLTKFFFRGAFTCFPFAF